MIGGPYAVNGPLPRRAITNHKHGCRFMIGEDIQYVQEKGKLIVLDLDGKACDLDIIKQEIRHRPEKVCEGFVGQRHLRMDAVQQI